MTDLDKATYRLLSIVYAAPTRRSRAKTEPLPTRFRNPRDQSLGSKFAESDSRQTKTPVETTATPTLFAPINQASRTGIARELSEAFVVAFSLEFGSKGGILSHRLQLPFIPFNPSFLRHKESGDNTGKHQLFNEKLLCFSFKA
jgi:hypothetical protein